VFDLLKDLLFDTVFFPGNGGVFQIVVTLFGEHVFFDDDFVDRGVLEYLCLLYNRVFLDGGLFDNSIFNNGLFKRLFDGYVFMSNELFFNEDLLGCFGCRVLETVIGWLDRSLCRGQSVGVGRTANALQHLLGTLCQSINIGICRIVGSHRGARASRTHRANESR